MDIRKTILSLRSIANVLRKVCVVSAAIAAFSSCANDSLQDDLSQSDGKRNLNLALSIKASSLMTRGLIGGNHALNKATEAESHLNISEGDFAIFVYDDEGNFVQRFEPGAISITEQGDDDITYLFTGGLQYDSKELPAMRLMITANWQKDFKGNYIDFENAIETMKLDSLDATNSIYAVQNPVFNFTMPTVSDAGNVSWCPSANSGIPMFGLSNSIDLTANPEQITPADIPLLRSLAKIEIRDMVPNASAKIQRCVLTKYNAIGRFIPNGMNDATEPKNNNTAWAEEDKQVMKPSLPAAEAILQKENLQFAQTKLNLNVPNEKTGTSQLMDKDVFTVYIPEMDLSSLSASERPVLLVYVEGVEKPYEIFLSDYAEGKPKEGSEYSYLLRNHIYRFDIISVGSAILDFIIQTPWEENPMEEWEYDDVKVAFRAGEAFSWDSNTTHYEEEESLTGPPQRTLIVTQDEGLEGSFTLTSPAKGKWTLALYGDDNTLNSYFRIDIKVGDTWQEGADAVTGDIGDHVVFRIMPVDNNNSTVHYMARIVLTCTTFDDQMVEVNLPYVSQHGSAEDMTPPNIENKDYFYVKQYYTGFSDPGVDEVDKQDIDD